MDIQLRKCPLAAALACWLAVGATAQAADPPTPDRALRVAQPVQTDVQIDTPEAADVPKCTVKGEKIGGTVGWVVRDPQGLILRRFLDTNGDNFVDQWCYYKDGVEVYRDIDTNFNQKADQCRWLNTAGSRWGIDANEDKKIDYWQAITAEEVSAELVAAIRDRDRARFERLLLSGKELKALGLGKAKQELLAKKLEMAIANFATLTGQQKAIAPGTKWVAFAASQPGTVPAGTEESTADVLVYENAAAMLETDGKGQAITLGTLVKADNAWRLIDVPQIQDDSTAEVEPKQFFFAAARSEQPGQAAANQPTDKARKLLDEYHKLGDLSADSTPAQLDKRVALLEELVTESEPELRPQWYKQLADLVSAAVQSGNYPAGIAKLQAVEEKLKTDPKDEELAFYFQYRRMTAEHTKALSDPMVDFAKIQTKWVEDLEKFVSEAKKYPDSADAMLELAVSQEFAGQEDKALHWYETIVKDYPQAPIHKKAEGARTRLSSVGRSIPLSGKLISGANFDLAKLKGKVVVVQYWATWCEPCKADMPLLKDLRARFKDNFEVIGVCLDNDKRDMLAFLKENDPRWPQLFEDGGMESRFAVEMGIQTVPTMLLIDKQGKVVDRNVRAQGLEGEVKKLLK